MTTLVYPQLGSGALAQLPVRKNVQVRTIVNRASDGSCMKSFDAAAGITEWELEYSDLTDSEAGILETFFIEAEGRLNSFTFLDPVGNLFALSDALDAAVWEKDPLLTISGGLDDPRGGKLAWSLKNNGGAAQSLAQTLAAPVGYLYCVSVYAAAAQPTDVTLFAGSQRNVSKLPTQWSRISFTATPDTPRFGIEVPSGEEVTVFGLQVEPQPAPSAYRSTARGGVYEGARLKHDSMVVRATGFNRHSCTVKIIHANHL